MCNPPTWPPIFPGSAHFWQKCTTTWVNGSFAMNHFLWKPSSDKSPGTLIRAPARCHVGMNGPHIRFHVGWPLIFQFEQRSGTRWGERRRGMSVCPLVRRSPLTNWHRVSKRSSKCCGAFFSLSFFSFSKKEIEAPCYGFFKWRCSEMKLEKKKRFVQNSAWAASHFLPKCTWRASLHTS